MDRKLILNPYVMVAHSQGDIFLVFLLVVIVRLQESEVVSEGLERYESIAGSLLAPLQSPYHSQIIEGGHKLGSTSCLLLIDTATSSSLATRRTQQVLE